MSGKMVRPPGKMVTEKWSGPQNDEMDNKRRLISSHGSEPGLMPVEELISELIYRKGGTAASFCCKYSKSFSPP